MAGGRVVMGLMFFPRGGSAQVVRYLVPVLRDTGWAVTLATGSLGEAGEETHAGTFFAGIDLQAVDYSDAVRRFEAGESALDAPVPMHPSFEDREGVPDVVLAAVDPSKAERLAAIWAAPFEAAGADQATVFHLHHLTPQHDTVARRWPDVPVLAHLHGTELKLLEAIALRADLAHTLGSTLAGMPDALAAGALDLAGLDDESQALLAQTRWDSWRHGQFWETEFRRQAIDADHLVVVSPPDRATAIEMFGLEPEQVSAIPNGVDIEHFGPQALTPGERRSRFRRWLVEDPQGWDSSGLPGSVRYRESDLDRLDDDATVLVFVGRFTSAKRVPLLVRAFARARDRSARRGSLLIWGGHPGEWEDEHPVDVAREVGEEGIYFAGWRGHSDLPDGLAACDALVMPSVNDSYPQTALEAMAAGLPVLGTLSGGFPSMVNLDPTRPTGWLIPPDDIEALTQALVDLLDNMDDVRRRGSNALDHARRNLSWSGLVPRFEEAYGLAVDHRAARRSRGRPTSHR